MKEEWKPIKGYEDFYEISNLGNIRSIAVRRCLHGKIYIIKRTRYMVPTDNGHGYLIVSLKANNNRKSFYIHRLVADHFLNKPVGKNVVNHIDYNTKNNVYTNLEWCTQKENVRHSIPHMRKPHRRRTSV